MKVLVTGGTGFLGKYVMAALKAHGMEGVALGTKDGDLTLHTVALRIFQQVKADAVIHLAAQVGGIGANRAKPGEFWQTNTMMGVNVLDACLATGVKRVLIAGTTCSYPAKPTTIPFIEEELFEGYPEPTNAPYGMAKRNLIVGAMAYRKQFGLDCVTAVMTNLYGPGDSFHEKDSHVVPALIQKMHWATVKKEKTVDIWGSGRPTRDLLYATDAATAVVTILERASSGDIVNVGSGVETTISALAELTARMTGFKGHAHYNKMHPDGQVRRVLEISRAKSLGWQPTTKLAEGLEKTYEWWKSRG